MINYELKERMHGIMNPHNEYKRLFKWYGQAKGGGYWAHIEKKESPLYTTLDELIADPQFIAIWNDERLVKKITFRMDRMDGPGIGEEEAISLNSAFDPSAPPPATPGAGSSSTRTDDSPPATEQAPKRRRTF